VLFLAWFSAVAITIVFSKPTLSNKKGFEEPLNLNSPSGVASSSENHYSTNPLPIHGQGSSGVSYTRKEISGKPNAEVPRRLKVPAKVFLLLSDYEEKRAGETKKVVSSSMVGLMQKAQTEEDEEMQSRRLKVSTSIYNWLVANRNRLEDVAVLPQNFPSLEPSATPTPIENTNDDKNFNSVKPLYRCPVGNKTCQLQHMGL